MNESERIAVSSLLMLGSREYGVTTKQEEKHQGDFSSSGSTCNPSGDVENSQSDDSAKVKHNKRTEDMKLSVEETVAKILKNFSRLVYHLKDLRTQISQRISENPERYDIQRMLTPSREPTLQKTKKKSKSPNVQVPRHDSNLEWIPIGTGTTKIHKDKFQKVNWKSYTVATRTLLIAAFPRKVLATRSLTGKRSPAFQNKPPKMCLDPRTVLDIVIEIKDRFKVKENLVRNHRHVLALEEHYWQKNGLMENIFDSFILNFIKFFKSIITTKCADEAKMLKTRNKKKNEINKKKKNNAVTTATNVIITEQQ